MFSLKARLVFLAPFVPLVVSASQPQSLTTFVDTAGEHVVYISSSTGHINQLYFGGGGWVNQDLTAAAGGSPIGPPLTSFVDASGHEHIGYLDINDHVNQLYFNGSTWTNQDLTAQAGGNVGDASWPMTSYVDHSGGTHIVYCDVNENMDQLYNNGGGWVYQDVTGAGHGNPVLYSTTSSAFVDSSNYQHIAYEDTSSRINQLLYTPAGWQNQTLSNYGGSPAGYSPVTAFLDSSQGQHIAYVSTSSHVNELYYNLSTWVNQDLTALAGSQNAQTTALSGFIDGAGGWHVAWLDANDDINLLTKYSNSNWSNQNVSAAAGGVAYYSSPLSSFIDSHGIHIAYIGGNLHVYQLWWNGSSWANQDLTVAGGGTSAE